MNFSISKEKMRNGIEIMNSCGARFTGSKAHNNFINYLQGEIKKLGIIKCVGYRFVISFCMLHYDTGFSLNGF